MTIEPRAFRRAVHAFGASFIVYYLLPTSVPAVALFARWGPFAILLAAFALEALRLAGRVRSEALFGLREYERRRLGAYVYFGVAALLLLRFAPQSIAVPCIVGMAVLDPAHAWLREDLKLGNGAAFAVGAALATVLFAFAGWGLPFALGAGVAMALAEVVDLPYLDDDLLMGLAPAALLAALAAAGVADVPAPFLHAWGEAP